MVIPCHHEPDVLTTLRSLAACDLPSPERVEVWWVVNHGESAAASIQTQNIRSAHDIQSFAQREDLPLRIGLITAFDLPPKHAGVGLARKIGMDLAAERLKQVGRPEGVIVNLDADCEVSADYFTAVQSHFQAYPKTPGASLFYAHPLSGDLPAAHYTGIAYYELFLRYYTHGLRFAGFPFGFQTVGSSMAVRAKAYQKVGGMNRRKAGEDFYFLHKVIDQGGFSEINNVTVIPAARVSDRVPFGTGKAMADFFEDPDHLYLQYPLQAFANLKAWVDCLPVLYPAEQATRCAEVQALDPVLLDFLRSQQVDEKVLEIQQNTTNFDSFQKRFFQWFNGFRAMKALHALRDAYGNAPLVPESQRLLLQRVPVAMQQAVRHAETAETLLKIYRQIDRSAGPFLLK